MKDIFELLTEHEHFECEKATIFFLFCRSRSNFLNFCMVNQHINNHDGGMDITVSYNDNKLITCVSQHQALFDT